MFDIRRHFPTATVLLLCAAVVLGFMAVSHSVVPAASITGDGVRLPILMYHSILESPSRQGDYVLSPAVFESDIKYLFDHGYTSISAAQLIAHVYDGAPLPDKPVMITFDDGFLNNLTYAVPLLEAYDMCAVISVVGAYTERFSDLPDPNPAYAYLSFDDICEAIASGYIEIGNHSYDMHSNISRQGTTRKPGESIEAYHAALREDLSKLQDAIHNHCGYAPEVFAYPFGHVERSSREVIIELGFKVSLGSGETVNIVTSDPECLYNMGRFNRPAGISTETFMKRIQ